MVFNVTKVQLIY